MKKEISCVVCKAYLFEEDDVVHCPVCGAPHHRECYNSIGHCALEQLHGTPEEYSTDSLPEKTSENTAEKEVFDTCRVCGEEYDKNLAKCPKCSAPNFSHINSAHPLSSFDFLGGIPNDYVLQDGVTAKEAAKFVVSNTHRYIPKFSRLNPKKRVSWNWIAFLLPSSWMFSRKMYKNGIITALLTVISVLLAYPLTEVLYSMELPIAQSYMELMQWMMEKIPSVDTSIIFAAFIGSVLNIGIQIFAGLYGDYLYKKHVISSIKDIKENSDDQEYDYRKRGGLNFFLFFISAMIIQYIPSIIAIFI